jgi:hypothetical protein
MVSAFEGNKAQIKTMLRVIEVLMAAHDLPDVTMRRSLNQTVQDHETSRLT